MVLFLELTVLYIALCVFFIKVCQIFKGEIISPMCRNLMANIHGSFTVGYPNSNENTSSIFLTGVNSILNFSSIRPFKL